MSPYFKLSKAFTGAALIAIMSAGSAASATDIGGQRKPAGSVPAKVPGTGQSTQGTGPAGPLKGVIRLGPGSVRAVGSPILPAFGIDQLDKKYTAFAGSAKAYEYDAKKMQEVVKQCAGKGYTVKDQQAAGCTGNETMNQCMEKLYTHCVQTFSSPGASVSVGVDGSSGGIPPFSTKQFQQRAATAASEARGLSQLLNQYANEVEQKAKSLVP